MKNFCYLQLHVPGQDMNMISKHPSTSKDPAELLQLGDVDQEWSCPDLSPWGVLERRTRIAETLSLLTLRALRAKRACVMVAMECAGISGRLRLAVLPWAANCRPCREKLDVLRDTSSEHIRASAVSLN
jgi:hypothetical protein